MCEVHIDLQTLKKIGLYIYIYNIYIGLYLSGWWFQT